VDTKYREIKRLSEKLIKLSDAGLIDSEGFEDAHEALEFMSSLSECVIGLSTMNTNTVTAILNGQFEKTVAYA
jgi:hypothetical protein